MFIPKREFIENFILELKKKEMEQIEMKLRKEGIFLTTGLGFRENMYQFDFHSQKEV